MTSHGKDEVKDDQGTPLLCSGHVEQADIGETRVKREKTYKERLDELVTQLVTRRPRQDVHGKLKVTERFSHKIWKWVNICILLELQEIQKAETVSRKAEV